jgi:large conductance mechanosensitive channel
MATTLKEFRAFLLRGNAVDLAIAVVIGAAFGAVVAALVKDLLTPLIAAIFGTHDFSRLSFRINGSVFAYGDFLNAVLSFVIVAAVVFFLVVKPMMLFVARLDRDAPAEPASTRACPRCLSVIPAAATRCAHCTSELTAGGG